MNANPHRNLTDTALTALYESLAAEFVLAADLAALTVAEAEMHRRGLA